MGKSTNGPDWTDARLVMGELEKAHTCSISVEMKCSGGPFSSALFIVVCASWPDLRKPAGIDGVIVQAEWPNRYNATAEGCVYQLLLLIANELDLGRGGVRDS